MEQTNSLQVLDAREEGLKKLAADFSELKINGLEDVEGFKKVSGARKTLKAERVQIEKDAKELREGALRFQKVVIAREKELIAIIEPVENFLSIQEKAVEDEKERIRAENKRKEAERIQVRVNALAVLGHAIDFIDAAGMTDEQFNERLTQAQIDYDQEQERRLAEQRAKEEEEKRLAAERAEILRIGAENEEKERAIKAEQERIAKEQAEREAAIKAEQARKDAEIKAEQHKLAAERRAYEEQKAREEAEKKRQIELEEARKQAAEKARIEAEEKAKREAEEKIKAEERAKEEALRLEKLRPDKDKLMTYADSIAATVSPALSDQSALDILQYAEDALRDLAGLIRDKTSKL